MKNGLTLMPELKVTLLVQRNVLEPIVIITIMIIIAQRIVLGIIIVNTGIIILIIITQRNILGVLIAAAMNIILVIITVMTWGIVVGIGITVMTWGIVVGIITLIIIIRGTTLGIIIMIGNIAPSTIIIVPGILGIIIIVQGIAGRIMTDVGRLTTLANQWIGTPER
jgi:hypothetical protein